MRDLRPQYSQPVSLCDALDRLLDTGVVAVGEAMLSVADVDLLYLGFQLVITSIRGRREPGATANGWGARRDGGMCQTSYPLAVAAPCRSEDETRTPGQPACCRLAPASRAPSTPSRQIRDTPPQPAAPAPPTRPECSAERALPVEENVSPAPARHAEVKNGLCQLVLTLVKVLHELLKRQALRRVEAGSLNAAQMERLGLTLMRQAQEIERIAGELGLKQEDLNLDLGPLGKLL